MLNFIYILNNLLVKYGWFCGVSLSSLPENLF
jgi:hypothetical protein